MDYSEVWVIGYFLYDTNLKKRQTVHIKNIVDMFDSNIISILASYLEYGRNECNIVCDYIGDKQKNHVKESIKNMQKIEIIVKKRDIYQNVGYQIGTKLTFSNGELHSFNDEPAVECLNGIKIWYQNGKRHRDNGLPAYIGSDRSLEWYQNGVKWV